MEKLIAIIGAFLLIGAIVAGITMVRQVLPCAMFTVVTVPANRINECAGPR